MNHTSTLSRFLAKIKFDSFSKSYPILMKVSVIPTNLGNELPKSSFFGSRSSWLPVKKTYSPVIYKKSQIFNPVSLILEGDEYAVSGQSFVLPRNDSSAFNIAQQNISRRVLRVVNPDILVEKENFIELTHVVSSDGYLDNRLPNECQIDHTDLPGSSKTFIMYQNVAENQSSAILVGDCSRRNTTEGLVRVYTSPLITGAERMRRKITTLEKSISSLRTFKKHKIESAAQNQSLVIQHSDALPMKDSSTDSNNWSVDPILMYTNEMLDYVEALEIAVQSNNERQITDIITSFSLRGQNVILEGLALRKRKSVCSSPSFDRAYMESILEKIDSNAATANEDAGPQKFLPVNLHKVQDAQTVSSSIVEPSVAIFVEGQRAVTDYQDDIIPMLEKVASRLEVILNKSGSKFPLIKDRKLQLIISGLTPKNSSQRDPESLKVLLDTPPKQLKIAEVGNDLQSPMPREGSNIEKNNLLIWN